jgi:hypothetical protein
MVQLDSVVTAAPCSLPATTMQVTFFLQFADGRRIAAQAIARENSRGRLSPLSRARFKNSLAASRSGLRQVEVHRLAATIDRAEQVHPPAAHPHKRLIHVPTRGLALYGALQAAVDFGPIGLHPSPDGGVVHRKTTFGHEFFNIAQAERKPQL